MKNPLEAISELEEIIRSFHKIDSKMLAGQFIPAYRDIRRLLALFEERKKSLLKQESENYEKQSV